MLNDRCWLVGIWAIKDEVLISSAFIIIHRGRVSIYFIFLAIITACQYFQNISRAVSPLVCFYAYSQNSQKRLLASSCMFVCPSVRLYAWNKSGPTWWIFIKFDVWVCGNFSSIKMGKNKGYFIHEDQYAFLSYPAEYFLAWKMIQTIVLETNKTYFMFTNFFF